MLPTQSQSRLSLSLPPCSFCYPSWLDVGEMSMSITQFSSAQPKISLSLSPSHRPHRLLTSPTKTPGPDKASLARPVPRNFGFKHLPGERPVSLLVHLPFYRHHHQIRFLFSPPSRLVIWLPSPSPTHPWALASEPRPSTFILLHVEGGKVPLTSLFPARLESLEYNPRTKWGEAFVKILLWVWLDETICHQ